MRALRIGLALAVTTVVGLAAPQARPALAAGAPVAVDAAIVLAADVSRSIDDEEFALQRRGYADAIQSQQLIDAISTGPHGAISLAYVEWAGDGEDKIVVDWAVIRNAADAQAFAAVLTAGAEVLPRQDRHRNGDRFLLRDVRRERIFDRPPGYRRFGRRHQQPGAHRGRGPRRRRRGRSGDQRTRHLQQEGGGDGRLSGAAHQPAGRHRPILPRQRDRRHGRVRGADRRLQDLWRSDDAQARQRDRRRALPDR